MASERRVPATGHAPGGAADGAALPDGYPARLGLLDRTSPDRAHAKWYDVDPCFVFHMLNAYDDDDGTVVVDVLRRERAFVPGRPDSLPYLERWTVDPATGTVARRLLDDRPQEFPRIDDRRAGRRARYGYLVAVEDREGGRWARNAVVRQDLDGGPPQITTLPAGDEPSEFCFVPNPDGSEEDDGVLVGYVFVAEAGRSDLVVMSAAGLEVLARVRLPVRVPHGFHGAWLPSDGTPA